MADYSSAQYAKQIGGASQSYLPLTPRELEGRVRLGWFTVTKDAANGPDIDNGDVVNAIALPVGARVVGGALQCEIMGAGTTIAVGDAGSATRYKAATSTAAAAEIRFATTQAENQGRQIDTEANSIIKLTVGGADWTDARTLQGYVLYVVD